MPKGEIVFKNGDLYEGELKNDQPNGTGTYRFKNKSYYEGEFTNGKFHGRGKLVDTFSQLTIAGQFSEGTANGRCKVEYADGSVYEGEMKDGVRSGKGTLTFGGSFPERIYKGWFAHDQMEGQGELIFKNGDIYRGKFIENCLHGEAEIITQDFSYVGEVNKGMIDGKGSIKYSSGDLYEGQFQLCEKHGYGKYTFADGSTYQGQWDHDKKKGKGKIIYSNGDAFEGVFDNEDQQGSARWKEWNIEGQMKDNQLQGIVRMTKPDTILQGTFSQGYQEGLMKINKKVKNEFISYRGEFEKGHEKPYSVSYSKRV